MNNNNNNRDLLQLWDSDDPSNSLVNESAIEARMLADRLEVLESMEVVSREIVAVVLVAHLEIHMTLI